MRIGIKKVFASTPFTKKLILGIIQNFVYKDWSRHSISSFQTVSRSFSTISILIVSFKPAREYSFEILFPFPSPATTVTVSSRKVSMRTFEFLLDQRTTKRFVLILLLEDSFFEKSRQCYKCPVTTFLKLHWIRNYMFEYFCQVINGNLTFMN